MDRLSTKLNTVCNYCGSGVYTPVITSKDPSFHAEGNWTYVKCSKCGLIYLNPQPDQDSITRHYGNIRREYLNKFGLNLIFFLKRVQVRFSKRIPLMRGGNLLDVGCGEDPFLEVQKKRGYNVYGTDVDKTAREHFKKLGIEVRIGNLQNVKWSKNFFDVITLWHTLEHDVKPQETLKECYKILKDSGTLIISVPNFNSLERKIFNEHWIYLSPPRHIFQFTPESLSKVLADVGFRVYKVKYPGFSPQLWARSFLVFLEERKLIKLNSISRIFLTLVLFPFVIPLNLVSTLLKTGSVLDVYAEKKTP